MVEDLLELDFKLNAQGIDIWISKQNEKNKKNQLKNSFNI
jgi:hypothetical protein